MEFQPLLRLSVAVVMKFGVDLPGAEGIEEVRPDFLRELARVDGHLDGRLRLESFGHFLH